MSDAGQVVVRVGADISDLNSKMAAADGAVRGFGSGVGKHLKRAAAVGGAALIGLGALSLKAAGDYESSLNTFQAVSNATGSEMKKVGKLAKDLGRDITLPGTSAKDAAEAMTELAKGGLSVTDTMRAAKGVLQLSAAAQIDNAKAATITARALNAFHLEGTQAGMVADVLANAANASTGEITDMAMGLQQAGAVAYQAGLSVTDTATAISLMANAGIVGSDAGTSLKTMLMRLTPQTEKAANALAKLGIDSYDSRGKMLPLRNIIEQFSTSLDKLTPKQQQQALATIFGSDAIRGANIVLKEGVGAWDDMHGAMSRQGSAADLAAAKMKGFKGALEAFKSTVETLAISVGELLLPIGTKVARALSGVAETANKVLDAEGIKAKVQIVWEGGKGAVSKIATEVRQLLFGEMKRRPIDIGDGIIKMGTVKTAGIVEQVRAAFSAMDWSGVAASVASGIEAGFSKIGTMGAKLGATIGTALMSVDWVSVGKSAGPGIVAALASAFVTILDPAFWAANWELAAGVAFAALSLAFAPAKFLKFLPFGELIGGALRSSIGLIAKAFGTLGDEITRGFASAFPAASAAVSRLVSEVRGGVSKLPGHVGDAFKDGARAIGQAAGFLVAEGIGAVGRLISAVAGRLRGLLAPFEIGGRMAVQGLASGLRGLLAAVTGPLGNAISAVAGKAAAFGAAAMRIGAQIVSGIKTGLFDLGSMLVAQLSKIAEAISNVAAAAAGWAAAIGRSIVSGIISGLSGLVSAVGNAIASKARSAIDWAKNNVGSTAGEYSSKTIGKPLGEGILLGFLNGVSDLPQKIAEKTRNAIDAGKRAVEAQRAVFQSAFQRLAGDAVSAFDAETGRLVAAVDRRMDAALARIDAKLARVRAGIDAARDAPTAAEKEISGIEAAREQKRLTDELAAAELALADARKKATEATDPEAAAAAQKEIADAERRIELAKEEIRLAALRRQAEAERKAADDAAAKKEAAAEAAAEKERGKVGAKFENEKKQLEARRALLKRHLEDALHDMESYFTRAGATATGFNTRLQTIFKNHGVSMQESGRDLGRAFARGMLQSKTAAEQAAKEIAEVIEKYLKLRSPAEKGPLSKLNTWWTALGPTLISSAHAGGIGDAVAGALVPGGASGGGTIVIEHRTVVELDGRKVAEVMRKENRRHAARGGTV